jgi:hypothetical protein
MKNILLLLSSILKLVSSGRLSDAPTVSTPAGLPTPPSTPTTLKIVRKSESQDGLFGEMLWDGETVGMTVENRFNAIPEGLYSAKIDMSPRLGYKCPHIRVPSRDDRAGGDAGIRIHIANFPHELLGCIAPGKAHIENMVTESRTTFTAMMARLPDNFSVEITSLL